MKKYKLSDLCTKIGSGATPRGGKESYKASGIPIIRSQNVLDYSFSADGLAYIDEAQATQLDNVIVQSGDVLINITGDSVARACMAPDGYLPARVNQHVAIIRANSQKADGHYILYFLQKQKEHLLLIASSGGTRNALTKKMLEDLVLDLPPLPVQRKIAATLSALDDKIANNTKINHHLEQMAQAIFKFWFVDFEPFTGDGFIDSELGKIPVAWSIATLDDVCFKITDGSHFSPKDSPKGIFPMLSVRDMDSYGFNYQSSKLISEDDFSIMASNDCVPFINDILVAKDGSYLKHIFIVNENRREAILSSIAIFRPDQRVICPELLLCLLKNPAIQQTIKDNFVSGSALPRIVLKDFKKLKLVLPPMAEQLRIVDSLAGFRWQIANNQAESNTLTVLRDLLLPRLMSGETTIDIANKTQYNDNK